jgi:subtilisin family serine protease
MINDRLMQVMSMVVSGTAIPIIIQTVGVSSPTMVQELTYLGVMNVRQAKLVPFLYGTATQEVIPRINSLPYVSMVFYDEPTYAHVYPTAKLKFDSEVQIPLSDSVAITGAPFLWDQGITGAGVRIGVIDTGVSTEHDMLKPVLRGTYSAVPGVGVEDVQNHGSWCCSAACGQLVETPKGLLEGAAPGASLYALKALDDDGKGQMSWVIDCIEKAVDDFECDVISLSLGSLFDNGGVDPISYTINSIARDHNVIPCIAAGNSFIPMSIGSPGGAVNSLTVGSVAVKTPGPGAPSTFSSKGPTTTLIMKPDVAGPGGNVLAPSYVEAILAASADNTYSAMTGTSMATPQIAGCMALLKQVKNDLSRMEVEQLLAQTAFPTAKNAVNGYGLIQMERIYKNLTSNQPVPPIGPLQQALANLQSALYAPLAAIPRPESEELRAVRLF